MSAERKGVEFLVGLFLLAGFTAIAVMAVLFGRVGQNLQKYYDITVEFPNASGLAKGSDVLLSGARIGIVAGVPTLIEGSYAVAVKLNIRENVQIPRTAYFQIRTSGMLGDSYVDVVPPAKFEPSDFAQPGERIAGRRTGGLDELTAKGGEMMDKLNNEILLKLGAELDEIKLATKNVNERLLNVKNLKNIEDTFANLKTASGGFAKTSKDLDEVVLKAKDAVESAQGAMKTVNGTATDLKAAIGDYRKLADSATKTTDAARALVAKIERGEGALGMLINDRQTAENFRALISNMRRSGMLFYKDRPAQPATPAPEKKRGR